MFVCRLLGTGTDSFACDSEGQQTIKSGMLYSLDYAHWLDANGNRVEERRRAPQVPWSLVTETVAMDFNATRNRLLEAGPDSFAYDDEGQLIDRAGTSLSFDPEHRLTAIGAGTTFAYDGVGNRLRATRDGQVTHYIYDQAGNLLAEADGAHNLTRYYIHGAGLLAMVEANDVYHYHFDALGSTVALTDEAGAIVNAYAYSPYGRVINKTEGLSQPFQYVGQYGVMVEPEGLYYMRARYYDPEVGRFISEDPIGFEGGLNLYAYVGGNPINGIDPEGTWVVNAIGGFIGGVAGGVGACLDGCDFTDALIGFGTGAAAGAISPLTVARTVGATVARGAGLGGVSNWSAQAADIAVRNDGRTLDDVNYGAVVGSALGGGAVAGLTRPFGSSIGEQVSAAIFGFGPNNAAALVGQRLGK